ncbi:MAG: class I SAM-dependent methyltransferase [Chloroflexota bacterium]
MEAKPSDAGRQTAYWDSVAEAKTFSLPVDLPLLNAYLPLESKILDYGCGYGRVCQQLAEFGFSRPVGVDSSAEMIRRARQINPQLSFEVGAAADLPYPAGTFDAILLIAVLTCIPSDEAQKQLIASLGRLLRLGGILYIADYPLQTDERNRQRYVRHTDEFGTYGVFRLDEGGIFRHHAIDWITHLLADFATIDITYVDVLTMNGHTARAFQYCGKKED